MIKLSMEELDRMTPGEFREAPKNPVVIVLDNLRSQHNIGSIFRSADAFCAESICLCGITATPPHREIHKTALGATESVDWKYYDSTTEAILKLKEKKFTIVGVEQTRQSIPLPVFHPEKYLPVALIFGNEVNGIDENVLDLCDTCVEIPQYGTKHSLNVSVSAGIMLWHIVFSMHYSDPV